MSDTNNHNDEDQHGDARDQDRDRDNGHGDNGHGDNDRDNGRGDGDQKKSKDKKQDRPKSKFWPRVIIIVVLAVLIVGGVIYYLSTKDLENTDDAYTDGRAIPISPKISGYVTQLLVNDNQRVKAGQLLIQIDPRDYITARDKAVASEHLAEAQLVARKIDLEVAQVKYPADLAQAIAQRDSAKADLIRAKADLARQRGVDPRATTQQQTDQALAAEKKAQAQLDNAEAQVRTAQLAPQNIEASAAQVKQTEAQVEQAKAEVAQAELNLSYTQVVAPQDGWVTKRNVEQGNLVQSGQSLMSVVTPEIWITANYKESQLDRMRPGQHVRIEVDAYPNLKLDGHVDSIQAGSGSRFTAFPPENATGNFVKIVQRVPVKIVIDNKDPDLYLPLGLSVEPVVDLK